MQTNSSLSEATGSACDPLTRAQILIEALPYIQQYQGRVIVIKYGGAAMVHQERRAEVLRDIVFLACVGIRPVLVHGGGGRRSTVGCKNWTFPSSLWMACGLPMPPPWK